MAARKIGATIALDGADQFKNQVTNCNKALAGMKAELGKTKAEFDGNANSVEALTQKEAVLQKTLDVATKKQTAVNKALEASKKAEDDAAKAVEKQKAAVDKAQKELDDYRKSTDKTADGEKELEKALANAQRELDKAEKGYDRAEKAVLDWTTQQAKADTEVITFNKALQETDRYLDEAKRSADGTASSIDEYGKKTKDAADHTGDTVTALGKLEGLKTVSDVMGELGRKMGELSDAAINAAKALDEGYDTIITKTGATGEDLARFTEIADNLYGRLPEDMTAVASAVGEVNTRFGLQGDELEELSEQFVKFAKINGTDVSGSVDKVQKALTAFGRPASDAATFLDAMTKAGQQSGIGMDTLSSSLITNATALQEMGLSLEDSVKFVGQLEKSGVDTSSALAGMSKALKTATKDGKSIDEALADLEDTILNGKDGIDGLTAAYDLFGRKGDGIFNAIKNGSLSFKDITGTVNDFAGTVDKTYDATLDAWDKWEVATNNLKGAVSDLTQDGLEALTPAIEKASDVAKGFRSNLQKLPEPLRKTASASLLIAGEIGKAIPKVVEFGADLKRLGVGAQTAGGLFGGIGKSGGLVGAIKAFATSTAGIATITIGAAAGIGLVAGAVINATGVLDGLDSRIGDVAGAANEMSQLLADGSSNLQKAMDDAEKSVEMNEATFGAANALVDELETLNKKTKRTADENARMKRIVEELNTQFPNLKISIDETTGALDTSIQSIRNFIDAAKESAMIQVYQEAITNGYRAVFEAQEKVYASNQKLGEIENTQAGIQKQIDDTTFAMKHNRDEAALLQQQLTHGTFNPDYINQIDMLDQEYERLAQDLVGLNSEMEYVNQTHAAASDELNTFKDDVAAAEGQIDTYVAMMEEAQGHLESLSQETEGIGEDVTSGFDIGMKKGQDQLETTAGNMGSSVIRNLEKSTGVASPSKYTMQTGRYIAQGLIIGETQMRGQVAAAAASLAAAGNVAAYADIYIAAAQQTGLRVAMAYAQGLASGRGTIMSVAASLGLTSATAPTPRVNGSPITQNNTININGAPGQSINQIADAVSNRINRQVMSLRGARG